MSSSVKKPRVTNKKVRKMSRWYRGLNGWGKAAVIAGTTALSLGLIGAASLGIWLHYNKLPDVKMLETYRPVEGIQIFDRNDKLVVVVSGEEDRQVVPLKKISPNMRKAMMAAEDHDFYNHGGINPSSIARAILKNLKAGRIVEGGSTITQQLVKNLFFPGEERTFNRKIKEFFLAMQVDNQWSKDKILEMYLNQIYFGNQAYGIERAAQRYFSKDASNLSLAEAAFLAGVVKAPTYLSDPDNRTLALNRQKEVLDKLAEYELSTPAEVATAKTQKLTFRKYVNPYQKYPYYISYVMDLLRQKYDQQELQRGLKVYTNMDQKAQIMAEKALEAGIKRAPHGINQGALVSLRVSDGAVLSLVGGVGKFEKYQWNRAVSAHTMGSSFKPFVYLSGFMKGLTPDSIVLDSPVSVPSGGHIYSPKNFDNEFKGPMTIRTALAQSRNVCAIRVAMLAKIDQVINTARSAGISSRLDPYLPIALGACAASPLEMAGAYSTFARGGVQMAPQVLRRVESPDGTVLASFQATPRKVFDSQPVAQLVDIMQTAVQKGTGMLGKLPDRPVAGKTGTADNSRDIWFVGFTPDVCTAVWGGNDLNKRVGARNATGGMFMSRIFKEYMQGYYKEHPTPIAHFTPPAKQKTAIASANIDGAMSAVGISSAADKKKEDAAGKVKDTKALAAAKAARKLLAHRETAQIESADSGSAYAGDTMRYSSNDRRVAPVTVQPAPAVAPERVPVHVAPVSAPSAVMHTPAGPVPVMVGADGSIHMHRVERMAPRVLRPSEYLPVSPNLSDHTIIDE